MRSLSGYRSAVEYLKLHDPVLFKGLNESTVRGWFVQGSYTDLNEKTKIALKRGKAFYKPSTSGRKPTLDNFPNIRQELVDTLQALRDSGTLGPPFLGENNCITLSASAGTALNLVSVQPIMKAVLQQRHPEILSDNGGPLKVSKWFCKSFVRKHLNWSFRRATTAAQKLPENWEKQVDDMVKRLGVVVFEGQVPKELLFSMDETFSFFVPMGHTSTLAPRGSKVYDCQSLFLARLAVIHTHLHFVECGGHWCR